MKEMTHRLVLVNPPHAFLVQTYLSVCASYSHLKSDWPNGREQALHICEIIEKHCTLRQEMLVTHALNFIFAKHFHQ